MHRYYFFYKKIKILIISIHILGQFAVWNEFVTTLQTQYKQSIIIEETNEEHIAELNIKYQIIQEENKKDELLKQFNQRKSNCFFLFNQL